MKFVCKLQRLTIQWFESDNVGMTKEEEAKKIEEIYKEAMNKE